VARLADVLLYPLWNAGLDVGHAVRTPQECEEAVGRLDVGASMLDIRCVAGDDPLVADVAERGRRGNAETGWCSITSPRSLARWGSRTSLG
jgi:[protein-PII] uridylyltransferase